MYLIIHDKGKGYSGYYNKKKYNILPIAEKIFYHFAAPTPLRPGTACSDFTVRSPKNPVLQCRQHLVATAEGGDGVRLVDSGTITCGVADPFASRIHDTAPYRPCANMKALVAG